MDKISIKKIAEITGGRILCGSPDLIVDSLAWDSRQAAPGSLFIPIKGEKTDAHRFILQVLKNGACSLTSEHDEADAGMTDSGMAVVRVSDTLRALQAIGRYIRTTRTIPVIGVTGSVGKTTTREMTACALASGRKVFQTVKNYNSQIGVPVTLSLMPPDAEIAVLEMGMSEPGEMSRLADMVRPDAAVFTMIGVAHINQLKTQDNIFREKKHITDFMDDSCPVFLNGDDPILMKYRDDFSQHIITFGLGDGCSYRAENIRTEDDETVCTVITPETSFEMRLALLGEHNVRDALSAIAVCDYYGVDVRRASDALRQFHGQRQRTVHTPWFTMVDDTYNASPDSVRAALSALRDMKTGGRKIAVLGDMLELGPDEQRYHAELGPAVDETGVDLLITYGALAQLTGENCSARTIHAQSLEEIIDILKTSADPEDVVLLKGSNGMKLGSVAAYFEKNSPS